MKESKKDLDTTRRSLPGDDDGRDEGASVVIIRGEPLAKVFRLDGDEVVIGRAADCDIQFGLDNVSRHHCRIRRSGDSFVIRDLGATNTTTLNGRPLVEDVLHDADRIGVGDIVLKFVAGNSPEAEFHSEAYARATEDPLTGVANRRLFEDVLAREVETCLRHGQPLSICVLDADRFKRINDHFDHSVGDAVLVWLTDKFTSSVRELDTVARVGGEEFVVVLPGLDLQEAARYARKQRELIAAEPFVHKGTEIAVTISIGVAEYSLRMRDPWMLFQAADRALAQAKQAGRNQVCIARDDA